MKMQNPQKRILALILALAMSLSLSAPAWAAEQESDTSAAQVETLAESTAEEAPEESTQAPETAEVSAPVEESAEEPQAEEPEEEAVQEEPQAEEQEEEAAPQEDEETEAPAQEEAQSEEQEEAAEAEESTQKAEEPKKDADETLAPQEDENLEYKWQVYKKFLEYQKAGKNIDFAYHYDVNGFTVEMTPVGNGKFNAVINGKGVCDSGYNHFAVYEFIDANGKKTSRADHMGYERCGVDLKNAPESIEDLLKEMGKSKAADKYLMPEINHLTFGSGITGLKEIDGFFGYDKVRNITIPGNVKTVGVDLRPDANGLFAYISFKVKDKVHKADYYDEDRTPWGYKLRYHHFDTVVFQNGVEKIGERAFENAVIKGGLVIPSSVKQIEESAFDYAEAKFLDVNGDVYLGDNAFDHFLVTTDKIVFHGNVTLDHGVFIGVYGATKITFEKNYNSVEGVVFSDSADLKEVVVKGDARFGKVDFYNNPNLKCVSVNGNARFSEHTFEWTLRPTVPETIYVGGNARFDGQLIENYDNDDVPLSKITVEGKVKSSKDTWKGSPFEGNGIKSHGTTKAPKTKKTATLSATKLTSVKYKKNKKNAKKSTTTIKWKRNKKGTGYQLQYSTNKKFKKGVKTINIKKNKITSKTIKGMKKGKYFFRIRVTGKKGAKSKWSKVKNLAT